MLAVALIGVSSAAVLVRLAAAPSAVTAFWRLALSLVVTVPLLAGTGQWRTLAGLTRREWLTAGAAGGCLALHFLAWFESLEYTSVASSTVLVSVHPLFVGLLSAAWLREAPAPGEWAGIVFAVGGAALIGWGDFRAGPDPLRGDLLAVAGAVAAACYFVAGRRLRARLGLWSYVTPVYAIAAAVTAGVAFVGGDALTGYPDATWWAFAGLALAPMLLGHTGFNWALRYVRAYVVSLVQLLEPVGATLLAIIILGAGESPAWTTVAGGAVILVGVWLSLRSPPGPPIGAGHGNRPLTRS